MGYSQFFISNRTSSDSFKDLRDLGLALSFTLLLLLPRCPIIMEASSAEASDRSMDAPGYVTGEHERLEKKLKINIYKGMGDGDIVSREMLSLTSS